MFPTSPVTNAQLVSAVTNLLSNAVKYTPEGGEITARVAGHGNEIAIAVADSGIGIPKKDINRVFERFYRVDRGRHVSTGGTGLGLSIVRHVAVNHGGRVELASEEGVGSTFSIILPSGDTLDGLGIDGEHLETSATSGSELDE